MIEIMHVWTGFACNRAEEPAVGGAMGFNELRDDAIMLLICPTCQNVFAGFALGIHARDHLLLCMGLFSIFWLGAQRGPPFAAPVRLRFRFAQATPDTTLHPSAPRGCATRSPKGEAWWARQDSNLQPDRYERQNIDQLR
ncbi:hypothetical protein [Bradyrhizobium sp. AZCC 1678]|uniref:hypothetical protein n=1 Tax=Bradyrhizobium sp. AZCC 1678 TaxID=3117030 RepID=UPI002FF1E4B3